MSTPTNPSRIVVTSIQGCEDAVELAAVQSFLRTHSDRLYWQGEQYAIDAIRRLADRPCMQFRNRRPEYLAQRLVYWLVRQIDWMDTGNIRFTVRIAD